MLEKSEIEKSLKTKKSGGKFIYFLFFIIIASGLVYFFYFYKIDNNKHKEVEYVKQKVKKDDLIVVVSATGHLQPTNSVDIGIEVSGTIKEIYVDYNDKVKVGQILAKLDTTKLQTQLNSAKAGLAIVKATLLENEVLLKSKKIKLDRANEMYKNSNAKFPSVSEMDDYNFNYEIAKATYEASKAKVEQSLFEVKTAEDNLAKAVVVSSIDGIVLNKNVEIGQTIAATMQTPILFTLARDLLKMELIVSVDEADIGGIKNEQNVTFSVDAYPKRTFSGEIKQIRLKAKEVNGVITYDTVVSVNNDELLLKPNMTATAQIVTKIIKNKLLIPNSALRFTPKALNKDENRGMFSAPKKQELIDLSKKDERSVWILKEDKPIKIKVEVIDSDGKFSAIESNELNENDEVIISQEKLMATNKALIEFRNVVKTYGVGVAKTYALNRVDFSINEGEFIAIMGASGSGKSTTMNIIGCLDKPTSGEYLFNDINVEKLNTNQMALIRRNYIGFVFQGFNLLGRTTALENVELPLIYRRVESEQRKKLAYEALKKVGLENMLNSTPAELSGGQQQRVAIARAIVTKPLILLADEPTGNLDSMKSIEIMELLKFFNEKEKITIIMVTHEKEMATYANRIIYFKDGNIENALLKGSK